MKDNGTICAAFWQNATIRQDGKLYACSRYRSSIGEFDGNLQNILTLPILEQLRKDSADGIANSNCQKCYNEEAFGRSSTRQWFNDHYDTSEVKLKHLYVGFNNVCNLACDGCSPEFSSTWGDILTPENKKKNIISIRNIPSVPDSLDCVVFLGGEPLMTNSHFKFLSDIKNKSNVSVEYNTNGMFMLNEKLISLLANFKSVLFTVSIDGYEDLNSKVRAGTTWSNIINFINQIQQLGYELRIHTVIHKNNWHGLPAMIDYIKSTGFQWRVNLLTWPKELDIVNLDQEQKEKCLEMVKNLDFPSTLTFYSVGKDVIINHLLNIHN